MAPAPASYQAEWFAFDNATGESRPLGMTTATTTRLAAPAGLDAVQTGFIHVQLSAPGAQPAAWAQPVHAYFRRESGSGVAAGRIRATSGLVTAGSAVSSKELHDIEGTRR